MSNRETPSFCEELESRNLMSTVSLNHGVLYVRGTWRNDRIVVSQVNSRLYIDGFRGSVRARSVGMIAVDGGSGNDQIVMMNPLLRRGTQYIYKPTVLVGGFGDDLITGGAGRDLIEGGQGNDSLYGTWGNDVIQGGDGNDYVHAGDGDDVVTGDGGADYLLGANGNDRLHGGDGNDTVDGGNGNDLVVGGYGYDRLLGGRGTNALVENRGGGYRVRSGGTDLFYAPRAPVSLPMYSSPPAVGSGLWSLGGLAPYLPGSQPQTFLQSALGPDLYNAILVQHRVPSSFGWL
jgi:Ca2+-binding RTX toxin-like protein